MKSRIETAIFTCMVLGVGLVLPVVYKATTQDQTPDPAESTPKNRVMVQYSTAEAVPDSPIKPVLPGDTVEISLSKFERRRFSEP